MKSLSLDQVAQELHVSKRTIYNRITQGKLNTIRVGESQRVLMDEFYTELWKRENLEWHKHTKG